MIEPAHRPLFEPPRARGLRALGMLLLLAGLGANVWMLGAHSEAHGWRLAVMLLAPGLVLLIVARLVEGTPSMRCCLTLSGLILAVAAAFWAYVGVEVALAPPPEAPTPAESEAPLGGYPAPPGPPGPSQPTNPAPAPDTLTD
ncbi:MAG: hypothetical protein AB7Y46_08175 [Armatimonadota bacterium]